MSNAHIAICQHCNCKRIVLDGLCYTCRALNGASAVVTRDRVLEVLAKHIGKDRGVNIHALANEVTGFNVVLSRDRSAIERRVRKLVEELRIEGQHVCAHPANGYYLAANADELEDTCKFLYERAMTSLRQVAAMKKVSLPDLHGQLHLRT